MKSHTTVPIRITADGVTPALYECAICHPELVWRKEQKLCMACGQKTCTGEHPMAVLQLVQMAGPEPTPPPATPDPSSWAQERAAAYRRAGALRLALLAVVVLVFAALIAATIAATPAAALPLADAPTHVRAVVGEVIAWAMLIALFALAGAAMACRNRERRR